MDVTAPATPAVLATLVIPDLLTDISLLTRFDLEAAGSILTSAASAAPLAHRRQQPECASPDRQLSGRGW